MNPIPLNNAANYEVESILGKGGMGVVYLAHDKRLNRKVAIKCIRQNRANEHWVEAVQEEAKLLAQINHTNIVQIYDLIDWHGVPALVMEYVCGRTLLDLLNSDELHSDAIDFKQRLDWLKQIAEGLACAHAKGIIHRDLKPENIMIASDGAVKIMDFGIARHQAQPKHTNIHDSQVLPGEFVGSPGSLSPEQALGEDLTTASDVFSFGILAYSLMCGHHPFGDTSDTDTLLHSILYRAPAPFRFNVESDERGQEVAEIIERSLHKKANSRPKASQMAAAFKPLSIKRVETVLVETDSKKSQLVSIAVAAGAVFLLIVVISLWTAQSLGIKPRYIAVLTPNLLQSSSQNEEAVNLLLTSLNNTIQEAALSDTYTQLVDRYEWQDSDSPEKIGQVTGATDIIRSEVTCKSSQCNITLELLQAPDWKVRKKATWPVYTDSSIDIFHTTWQQSQKLLNHTNDINESIDSESYSSYLILLEKFKSHGTLSDQEMEQLIQQQALHPRFIPIYRLLIDAAAEHFQIANSGKYLKAASDLLTQNKHDIDINTFSELQALIYIYFGDFSSANREIDWIKRHGNLEKHAHLKASLLLKKNDFSAAEIALKTLITTQKSTYNLYSLAYSQYALGKLDASISTLRELISINPNSLSALSFLAGITMSQGHLDEAEATYLKILSIQEDSTELNNLAVLYILKGETANALKFQEKSYQQTPHNPSAILNLAEIHLIQGNSVKAESLLTETIKNIRRDGDVISLSLEARANLHLGNLDIAEQLITQALTIDAENIEVLYTQLIYFTKKNQLESAIHVLKRLQAAGLTNAWFSLPWFKNLCTHTDYKNIFTQSRQNPCLNTSNAIIAVDE
ncbi:hypothetical protein R50072_03570 [Simiduia litorea]|uniref:protein kinase domain-containing protein n=1 Tax=Simiduia litorea TaxID=1435348 RepID=UPI0036F317C0